MKVHEVTDTLTGMPHHWKRFWPIGIIVLFSLFLFRSYILNGLVPFPANLLVATYEPWKSYPVPEYPNGPVNKPMGFDNLRIYYPLKTVTIDLVRRLEPPLWNPYNFTGNTMLATYQAAVFHPLNALYLLLPQIDAWSIIIMMQPILAGLAMYAFLSVLEFSLSARLMGTLTFAFSGFFIVWWEEAYMFTYSSLFLPLTLSAVELFLKQKRTIWLAAFSLAIAGSVVSGAFQMTFYLALFSAIWIIYRLWHEQYNWHALMQFIGAALLGILLSSVHLIPSMEAYYYSSRIAIDAKYIFESSLLPFTQLMTLVAPDVFGNPGTYNYFGKGFYHERVMWFGLVPLFFVLIQLFRPSKQHHAAFFRYAFLITISLVLALPTTWLILYHLKLPLLSSLTPSRMIMLSTFCAAVLTAYGTEAYWTGFRLFPILLAALAVGLTFVSAGNYILELRVIAKSTLFNMVAIRNLVIPLLSSGIIVLTLLWSAKYARFRKAGFVILTAFLLVHSMLFAKKFLYFSERRFVYPDVPVLTTLKAIANTDRFWTYENGYMEKNFATQYRLFSPEGYDSITIRRYAEFIAFANSHGTDMTPARSDAVLPSTDRFDAILEDPYRTRLLDLLDVRYILHRLKPDYRENTVAPASATLPIVWQDTTFAIHKYAAALRHAALMTDVRVVPDGRELLTRLFDPKTDIRTTVFLEAMPDGFVPSPQATGSADIIDFQPNSVTVNTQATDTMMLFLSDAYFPGWNAYVDGVQTPVYRANYAFRAVVAPKGNHTIVFRYEPVSWKLGILGTLAGLAYLAYLVRKRHS